MVDFRKRVGKKKETKTLVPRELYESLDRASDKGPLRPVQSTVLDDWHANRRTKKDVILKLHTGQGKTLVGLLMLQSKLNEGVGPAVYLCPNHFLVDQTVAQAKQFGFSCVTTDGELPDDFIDGRAILVTVIHKLFNGLSKFGLGARSLRVGSLVMDDAHACIDAIKDQFVITLRHGESTESNAYSELLKLFESDLRKQGDGTFEDILRNDQNAYLPVPYWDWHDKSSEVARILSRHSKLNAIKFAWPLLRDSLTHTYCLVSGSQVVIAPTIPPLDQFGSYAEADHRIFMSATVTDDSFLVKGLGLTPDTVQNPLGDPNERWSGEKMVLIPSLIDPKLSRTAVVEMFAKTNSNREYGIAALVPSALKCADWGAYGARVVNKSTIGDAVQDLKNGDYSRAVVIANYYDGIDLPDSTCRILVIDSKPFAEELTERYLEDRRQGSQLLAGRIARIVEQGMGRAVRGEKDYCVIILVGSSLIRALQAPGQRDFFSDQTRTQIEIGREIAEFAKEEITAGKEPLKALQGLIRQCLTRDVGWKEWYTEQMDDAKPRAVPTRDALLRVFQAEVQAERAFQSGNSDRAVEVIQSLIDKGELSKDDRGWYLQEMARYTYPISKSRSNELQRDAHKDNRSLLRPKEGMIFTKVGTLTPERRIERIAEWMKQHDVFDAVATHVDEIITGLDFGILSDRFEHCLQELATALGFESDRPDKEWKEGPDNLWGLRDNDYLLFEAKSEVATSRADVHKRETDQMNRSSAWFGRYYPGSSVTRIMVIPTKRLAKDAALNDEVQIMRSKHLNHLRKNVRAFFNEFRDSDLRDLSATRIQKHLATHKLTIDDLRTGYAEKPIAYRGS